MQQRHYHIAPHHSTGLAASSQASVAGDAGRAAAWLWQRSMAGGVPEQLQLLGSCSGAPVPAHVACQLQQRAALTTNKLLSGARKRGKGEAGQEARGGTVCSAGDKQMLWGHAFGAKVGWAGGSSEWPQQTAALTTNMLLDWARKRRKGEAGKGAEGKIWPQRWRQTDVEAVNGHSRQRR